MKRALYTLILVVTTIQVAYSEQPFVAIKGAVNKIMYDLKGSVKQAVHAPSFHFMPDTLFFDQTGSRLIEAPKYVSTYDNGSVWYEYDVGQCYYIISYQFNSQGQQICSNVQRLFSDFFYNADGQLSKGVEYYNECYTSEYYFEYNEGDLVKITLRKGTIVDGDAPNVYEPDEIFSYEIIERDKYGNWTKRIQRRNGVEQKIQTRKIEYW